MAGWQVSDSPAAMKGSKQTLASKVSDPESANSTGIATLLTDKGQTGLVMGVWKSEAQSFCVVIDIFRVL